MSKKVEYSESLFINHHNFQQYRSYDFTIKLQIRPFVGAHNTVGIDHIIMRISPIKTGVEEFKHIKSFQVPPHLKEYYKGLKL